MHRRKLRQRESSREYSFKGNEIEEKYGVMCRGGHEIKDIIVKQNRHSRVHSGINVFLE